jgi:predicted nucleic acid-binding protein
MGRLTLKAGSRVFLDTSALIYWVEEVAPFDEALRPAFEASQRGEAVLVVSALSVLETTVEPIRRGNKDGVRKFKQIIRSSAGIEYTSITDEILDLAAELRAKNTLRTPDAILLATAMRHHCDVFLTNDGSLKKFKGIQVLLVSDLL